jgi:hypothetical protein
MTVKGFRGITVSEGVHSELTELQSRMTRPGYKRVSISDVIASLLDAHKESVMAKDDVFAIIDQR